MPQSGENWVIARSHVYPASEVTPILPQVWAAPYATRRLSFGLKAKERAEAVTQTPTVWRSPDYAKLAGAKHRLTSEERAVTPLIDRS